MNVNYVDKNKLSKSEIKLAVEHYLVLDGDLLDKGFAKFWWDECFGEDTRGFEKFFERVEKELLSVGTKRKISAAQAKGPRRRRKQSQSWRDFEHEEEML